MFSFIFSLLVFAFGFEGDANGTPQRNRHPSAMQEDASDLESSAAALKIVSPDSDDYKLVFISSDSSSKEDDLEDSSSTSSSTNNNRHSISLDDCDWDYFEPGASTTAKTIFRDLSQSPFHSPDAHRRRVTANISPLDSPLFYRRGLNATDAACLRRHRLRESDTGTDEELLAQPESSSPTSSDGFVDIRRNLTRFKRTFRHSVSKSNVCNDVKKCECGHQPQYVPIPVPVPILLPLSAFQNWQPSDLLMTTTDEDDETTTAPARSQQLRAIQKKQAAELFQLWNSAAPDLILKQQQQQQHGQQRSSTSPHNEHERNNECRVESKMHENHKKAAAAAAAASEDVARAAVNDLAMHTARHGDGREQQCAEHKTASVEQQTPTNDVVATHSQSKSKQTTMTDDKNNRNCSLASVTVSAPPIIDDSSIVDSSKSSNRITEHTDLPIEKPSNGETTAIAVEAIDHEPAPPPSPPLLLQQSSEVASIATTNSISDLPASVAVETMTNKFRGVDSSTNNKNRVRKQQPRGIPFENAFGDDTSGSECVSSSDEDNSESIQRNYDVAGASRRAEDHQFEGASTDEGRSPSSSARECQSSSEAEATDTSDNESNNRRPKSKGFYKVFVVNKRNGASSESDSCSSNVNSTDSSDNDTDTDCGIVLNYVKMLPENEKDAIGGSACESIDGDENGLGDDNDEIVLCSIKQLADDDAIGVDVASHEQVIEKQLLFLEMAVDAANDNHTDSNVNVNECNDQQHTRNEEVDLDAQSIATIECSDDDDDASLNRSTEDVSIETNRVNDAAVSETAASIVMHPMENAVHEDNYSFVDVDADANAREEEERKQNETVMQPSNGQDSPIEIDQLPNGQFDEVEEAEAESNAKQFDETFVVNDLELTDVIDVNEVGEIERKAAEVEPEPKRTIKGKFIVFTIKGNSVL